MADAAPPKKDEWLLRNNPWSKVNSIFDDRKIAFRYKQAMTLSLVVIILCFFGNIILCAFVNFAGYFHLIPILLPCCKRGFSAFLWALISIVSIGASLVSFFLGLIGGCVVQSAVISFMIIGLELLNLFVLNKLDPSLRYKVRTCFKDCGCCIRENQVDQEKNELDDPVAQVEDKEGSPKNEALSPAAPKYKTPFDSDVESGYYTDTDESSNYKSMLHLKQDFNKANNVVGGFAKTMDAISKFDQAYDAAYGLPKEKQPVKQEKSRPNSSASKVKKQSSIEFEGENEGGKRVFVKREQNTLARASEKLGINSQTLRTAFTSNTLKFQHKSKSKSLDP